MEYNVQKIAARRRIAERNSFKISFRLDSSDPHISPHSTFNIGITQNPHCFLFQMENCVDLN